MLTEDGRYGIRIHATRPESTDHRTSEAPEVIIDQVLLVVEPVLIFAEAIPPTSGLGNETGSRLVNAFLQSLNIFCRCECPVIEEAFVDLVGNQYGKVRVATSKP